MKRHEFWQFETPYDLIKRHKNCPSDLTLDSFFRRQVSRDLRNIREGSVVPPDAVQLIAAWRHLRMGRPYCKVHAGIAEMLGHTSINIESRHLKAPLSSFEIRLPKYGNPFQERADSPPLRSILLAFNPGNFSELASLPKGAFRIKDDDNRLWIWMSFGEMVGPANDPSIATEFVNFDLHPDKTIEECLAVLPPAEVSTGYNPSQLFKRSAISLAISTCFFVSGDHAMVAPDISPRFVELYRKAATDIEREKVVKRSRQLGEGWWDLGREIELPRPIFTERSFSGGEMFRTWESRFSHIRSGHMRRQPYGPRTNPEYKVIFIPPSVVRPDLPARTDSRFVIKDDVLPASNSAWNPLP